MSDNRCKVMYLHPRTLLALFRDWFQYDAVRLPRFEGLPQDAKVMGVEWCTPRRCWQIVIHSSSFDEVPLGHELPCVNCESVRLIVDREHKVLRGAS